MQLQPGGMDVWYVDESEGGGDTVVVAIPVPFIRPRANSKDWDLVWEAEFQKAMNFRRALRNRCRVPIHKELHAAKFVSGRGRYNQGKHQFPRALAVSIYQRILSKLDYLLQPESIITIVAPKGSQLFGRKKLDAAMHALFQRMRKASLAKKRNGVVFFDAGHDGMYRRYYRRAQRYLPTGSLIGGWPLHGAQQNLPLTMFTKDANFKDSRHSHFIQIVDLVAYAALMLIRSEQGLLLPWQQHTNLADSYDKIPKVVCNLNAARNKRDPRGIVRL